MALQSAIEFIDDALTFAGSFDLSYTVADQRWYIMKDLPKLLQDFPSLTPSVDTFTHNDGTTVNLLKAHGPIRVLDSTMEIPITIWIHEDYPYAAPMVFTDHDHPLVDQASGAIFTPYLETWDCDRCNLVGLVRDLVKLFSCDLSSSPSSSFSSEPYFFSRKEALERLTGMVHLDSASLKSKLGEEIEQLAMLQIEMERRVEAAQAIIQGLTHERLELKRQAMKLADEGDILINWLKVHKPKKSAEDVRIDDALKPVDEKSKLKLQCMSEDRAIEDTIYALDEAVAHGVMTFEAYIRQVRMLAREQFSFRTMVVKLEKLHPP